jgi:hypothetical protein
VRRRFYTKERKSQKEEKNAHFSPSNPIELERKETLYGDENTNGVIYKTQEYVDPLKIIKTLYEDNGKQLNWNHELN